MKLNADTFEPAPSAGLPTSNARVWVLRVNRRTSRAEVNYDIQKLQIGLNFSTKANRDLIKLSGTLPTNTTDFTAKILAVDVGGVIGLFTPNKTG